MSHRTKRLALVIGNSNYQTLTYIPNAIKDATAIQQALETLKFEVTFGINKEKKEIIDYLSIIRDSWRDEASEIVVYYSGHGISIDGKVYIGPVDAIEVNTDFISENFLAVEVILNFLIRYRKDDKHPIIIVLDCCRSTFDTDNTRGFDQDPLRGVRGDNNTKKTNIAILYSTAEGHFALDGNNSDDHSPYTQLLLQNMIKDYTIDQIHSSIVKFLGSGKQVPWIYHCLYEQYKFSLTAPPEPTVTPIVINDSIKKCFYGVPHKNEEFVNRTSIIEEMEAALRRKSSSGEGSILALCGLGGMGKTQLMLHYCYLRRTTYDFIFWIEVDGWITALDSFRKLAINLGLDEESAKEKYVDEKIAEWVSDCLEKMRGWLLLLNNSDNTTIAKIFKFLPRIGGDIILTTQEHISPKIAKVINIGKMDVTEALSLLFGSTAIDSADHGSARYNNAKKIVAKLDYMALAVDLARAYVESMSTSFNDYLIMFESQRDILFSHQDEDNLHQYNHSLKTVWQLSFDRIRAQSPLAVELLEICSFLQPERIPVSIFKRQHAVLIRSLNVSSYLVISEANAKALKAVREAIAVLVKFSFATRTRKEDGNEEDPSSDVLEIHRLVQKVIHDELNDEQRISLAYNLASALKDEISFTDSYSSLTRVKMNAYLLHIHHFAIMLDINNKSLLTEDLWDLLVYTVRYLLDNGVYFGVEKLAKFVVYISNSIHGPEDSFMSTSLSYLARLYENQGNYTKAEPLYQRALAIDEKASGPEHPETATSLNNLALLYDNQGNYAKAEPLYQRALEISEKALGPEHPETAISLDNLASLYDNQGNYIKAEPLYQRALVICEKSLGPEHPSTATSLNNLALLYDHQGNYAKAEPLHQRALVICEKSLGPEHPFTAASLNNLAWLYEDQGNYAKAEPFYQRALAIREKTLGPEHPETAKSLGNLALLYANQGSYTKAEPLYQRALEICEKILVPEHPSTSVSLNNLALLYEYQGNYAKAKPLYQRALAINEKVFGSKHPNTVRVRNNLAMQ